MIVGPGAFIYAVRNPVSLSDTEPDAFSFLTLTGQDIDSVVESVEEIEVTGITGTASVSILNGEWQKNGGAWTSSSGTVVALDRVKVRHTTAPDVNDSRTTVLTIGGVVGSFTTFTPITPLPVRWFAPTALGSGDGTTANSAAAFTTLAASVNANGSGIYNLRADVGTYPVTGSGTLMTFSGRGGNSGRITIQTVDGNGQLVSGRLVGGRTPWTLPEDPYEVTDTTVFTPGFQIAIAFANGAGYYTFRGLAFEHIGGRTSLAGQDAGAIAAIFLNSGATATSIRFENCSGYNVRRLIDNHPTSKWVGLTIDGLEVTGYSKQAIRLRGDSSDIEIANFDLNSGRQDGDLFAIGIQIEGTTHDVNIHDGIVRNSHDGALTNGLDTYWNGDGITAESENYNITITDVICEGHTDGGVDLKSQSTVLTRVTCRNNKRNFRLWGGGKGDPLLCIDCVSESPENFGGPNGTVYVGIYSASTPNGVSVKWAGGRIKGDRIDPRNGSNVVVQQEGNHNRVRILDLVEWAPDAGAVEYTQNAASTSLYFRGTTASDVTAPTITSASTITVGSNQAATLTLTANETVSWTRYGGADEDRFTLVGNTLTLPARLASAPNDSGTNGVYDLTLQAMDRPGNTATQAFKAGVINTDFGARGDQVAGDTVTSNEVTVVGVVGATAAITISNGEYRIFASGSWGSWTTSAGTVANGNRVQVRHTAATGTVTTTVTIGGVSGTFTSTTNAVTTWFAPTGRGDQTGSSLANAAPLSTLDSKVELTGPGIYNIIADEGTYSTSWASTQIAGWGPIAGATSTKRVVIQGVDSSGNPLDADVVSNRTDWTLPSEPETVTRVSGWSIGTINGFRFSDGAAHFTFRNINFRRFGADACFFLNTDAFADDIRIENCKGYNIRRFLDHAGSSGSSGGWTNLVIDGLEVTGFSKSAIRLRGTSHDCEIMNFHLNAGRQEGDNWSTGIAIDDDAYDIYIHGSPGNPSIIENCHDEASGYWNADGISNERNNTGIVIEDVICRGMTDGGVDLKGEGTILRRVECTDNKRNFRLWAGSYLNTPVLLEDCISRNPNKRGGSGSSAHIHSATIDLAYNIGPGIIWKGGEISGNGNLGPGFLFEGQNGYMFLLDVDTYTTTQGVQNTGQYSFTNLFYNGSEADFPTAPTITNATTSFLLPSGSDFTVTLTANQSSVAWKLDKTSPDLAEFALQGSTLRITARDPASPVDANTDGIYEATIGAINRSGVQSATVTFKAGFIASSFATLTNQTAATLVTSAPLTITGVVGTAAVTIANGEWRKNGGSWTSSAGTVVLNDSVEVRHTTASNGSTATLTVLTVGGVAIRFMSVTAAGGTPWWTTGAFADLDYQNTRAFVNGIAYQSITDARTAGVITTVNGADRVAVTPGTAYALAGKGVTAGSSPSATPRFLAMVTNTAFTNYAAMLHFNPSTVRFRTEVGFNSAQQAAVDLTAGAGNSTAVRFALRVKANDFAVSYNGGAVTTDTAGSIPASPTTIVVGNRPDGARPWLGTVQRVLFINAEVNDTDLQGLLA